MKALARPRLVALFTVLALVSCGEPTQAPVAAPVQVAAVTPDELATLFASATGNPSGQPLPSDQALARFSKASPADPNWPVLAYLTGELRLQRDDLAGARASFRQLATWSVGGKGAGPYGDATGGSGLAVVALWRWLQILERQGGSADEVQEALTTLRAVRTTPLFEGMVSSGLLPALPLMEEDVARRLAHVAAAAGRPDALDLFLDFLSLDSTGDLDPLDQKLRARVIDEGLATPERLDLYQLRRQVSRIRVMERKRQSAQALRELWENQLAPTTVRAEAAFEWSNYNRAADAKKKDVLAALQSASELSAGRGFIAEESLYLHAMVQNRGAARDPAAFFDDMDRLVARFPNGRLVDDALYQVASEHLLGASPNPALAFSYFEKLRAFQGPNDFLDSAYVLAAIGMVDRASPADLEAADRLLSEYLTKFPDGPFRLRALFWRARIAEQRNDPPAAKRHFQQIIAEAPYDYYGLRARMHEEYGARAATMSLPGADSKTYAELRALFQAATPAAALDGSSPYHARLRTAQQSGLYDQARTIVDSLGKRFRNRLDNIALADLDKEGLIPAAALLLAWRQDAVAARDAAPSAQNRLQLAALLGQRLGDWPLAIAMTDVRGYSGRAQLREMQNDPRFLPTLYPTDAVLRPLGVSLAQSAWTINGSTAVAQSLMYAVMRNESRFYGGAISLAGALGLFQIMPATFEGRPDCWQSRPQASPKPTAAGYLFDPDRNTRFWACWVGKEFQPKTRDDIALMLVRHHAGSGNLNEWRKGWQGRAIEGDLELQIDCLRFPATRLFVQRVLGDMMIVDASARFETASDSAKPRT